MKIYIIQGSTGEYDSYCEWTVCAYLDENKAAKRVQELNDLIVELDISKYTYQYQFEEAFQKHPMGDPDFRIYCTGATYDYYELELYD